MMHAHSIVAILLAAIVAFSGLAKVRGDPRVVRAIHEVTRVPKKWFPWLAACEFAGALGLLAGLVWRPIGLAASTALVVYFIGAVVAHVRVHDFAGLGPATFILLLAVASLVTAMLGVCRGMGRALGGS
jgi:hypothetical protein